MPIVFGLTGHSPAGGTVLAVQGGFDDLVHWASIHMVIHRMLAAGRLP